MAFLLGLGPFAFFLDLPCFRWERPHHAEYTQPHALKCLSSKKELGVFVPLFKVFWCQGSSLKPVAFNFVIEEEIYSAVNFNCWRWISYYFSEFIARLSSPW